jgi:hypothetical protein
MNAPWPWEDPAPPHSIEEVHPIIRLRSCEHIDSMHEAAIFKIEQRLAELEQRKMLGYDPRVGLCERDLGEVIATLITRVADLEGELEAQAREVARLLEER